MESEIFTRFEKPSLILAGPGTGKTTTLIRKIINLINSGNSEIKGIIVCTFTRKATEELKLRLYSKVPISKFNKINFLIGTIHSICYELLARYSEIDYGDFQILSEDAQVNFIYSKLSNLGFSSEVLKRGSWAVAEELTDVFNKITDEQIDFNNIDFKKEAKLEDYCKVYPTYKRLLKRYRLFDFATIQETLLNEFISNPKFGEAINSGFNYFFVDEFQDVNNIQDLIFKTISAPEYNLTVVGDDDQSIYGFRGSNINNIYSFNNWFNHKGVECKKYILSKNYRSTSNIVSSTNFCISQGGTNREPKTITAHRSTPSHKTVLLTFESDIDEADYICQTILSLKQKDIISSLNDISILFRSIKGHSAAVISSLDRNNIPYRITGDGSLFESELGSEFIALVDYYLAKDIDKGLIFSDRIAEIDVTHSTDLTSVYTENEYIDKLDSLFNDKKFHSCIDLTYGIFKAVDFLRRYSAFGENIGLITSIVLSFDDYSSHFNPYGLYSYLIYLKSSQKVDFIGNNKEEAISLMTIHQAKGLEFKIVFMPSQNQRNSVSGLREKLDNLLNINKNNEEERRVFYVGCTRAEELLVISYSKTLSHTKKTYSPNVYFSELLRSNTYVSAVDLNNLEKQIFRDNPIQKSNEIVLSYNKIRLYTICPLAYKYAHEWNLETVRIGGLEFGKNIHRITEYILKKVKEGVPLDALDIIDIIEKNWQNTNFRSEDENEKFKKSAIHQIEKFIQNQKTMIVKGKIYSIEDEFNVLVKNDLITGRFDAVFNIDGIPLIIDFKTGDPRDYSSQLSFYSLCFKEKYHADHVNLAVYYFKSGSIDFIKPNPIEEEITNIELISQKIKDKKFNPTPGRHCTDCAYSVICDFNSKR